MDDIPQVEHHATPMSNADMSERCLRMATETRRPCVTFTVEGDLCLALIHADTWVPGTWHCFPHKVVKSDYI